MTPIKTFRSLVFRFPSNGSDYTQLTFFALPATQTMGVPRWYRLNVNSQTFWN